MNTYRNRIAMGGGKQNNKITTKVYSITDVSARIWFFVGSLILSYKSVEKNILYISTSDDVEYYVFSSIWDPHHILFSRPETCHPLMAQ